MLIVVSIYYYLIKYSVKQSYLLPCHVTNNKLEVFEIKNFILVNVLQR